MLRIRTGGSLRTIKRWVIRRGGARVSIRRARIFFDGQLRVVFLGSDPLSASVSAAYAERKSNASVSATSMCTIVGGRGPYAYSWSISSDTGTEPSFTTGSSFSTLTSGPGVGEQSGQIHCSVTDADGQVAVGHAAYYFSD